MLRSIKNWNLRIQEARGERGEQAHVFGAGNGWPDRATHLLHLTAGGRANSGQPRWRACVLAILSCYYVRALAKGCENLPGCSPEGMFALAAGVAEGGGEATPASLLGMLRARERLLDAREGSWEFALCSGVAQF